MNKSIIILFTIAMLALIASCDGGSNPRSTSAGDGINTADGYYTRGECSDRCPLNDNTVCKFDCRYINNKYTDCVYHFYSTVDGNPFWDALCKPISWRIQTMDAVKS